MGYIWQNPGWPEYTYDSDRVEKAFRIFLENERKAEIAFDILDEKTRLQIHVKSISDEIVSSLGIEGEAISYESVFSSIAKRLDLLLEVKGKTDAYADSVSAVALDAIGNRDPLTKDRLDGWNRRLLGNHSGMKPGNVGQYRKGPEYIVRNTVRGPEIIYTAVPPERVDDEMQKLIGFINSDKEQKALVKSAIAAQWFVVIHPYADGNGRISRAVSDYILSGEGAPKAKMFSMSSLILAHRKDYYERLNRISSQDLSLDLTDWIVWNIELASEAVLKAVETLRRTLRVSGFMKRLDPAQFNSREISILLKLADGSFFGKLTTEKWAKMTKCSTAAAQRDIRHLVAEGYLVPDGDKGPKTGYLFNEGLIDQLSASN